ncbi:MAG: hypothetical protein V4772_03300 [Pseudomonadota bacterium]
MNIDKQGAAPKADDGQDEAFDTLLQELGRQVEEDFNLAKAHRIDIERRWVNDLRQYKGVYEPEVVFAEGRSQLFLRLTRAKLKSTNARMGDMLFPAGDKNWTIQASPVPDIDPESYRNEIKAIVASQGEVDEGVLRAAINEVMRDKCEAMSKEIDDQLEEGEYQSHCRKVINSGNLFGTGVLKGPIGVEQRKRRWTKTGEGWELGETSLKRPSFSFVPLWNYYPDPATSDRRFCRFEIEHHPMLKADFMALAKDPAFMAERVLMAAKKYPTGNRSALEQWELDLRLISKGEANKPLPVNQYSVLERWGEVSGSVLAACGVAGIDPDGFYEGQVWAVGGIVIRVDINPYDSNSRPFKLYYLDKDESSIWGEGIPWIMRDPQRAANTSVRALLDNAAASAIPMFEVNTALMPDESDVDSIKAGRTWRRNGRGVDSQYPAIRVVEIPAKTDQFMSLLRLFIEMGDEVTTMPRYSYGGNDHSAMSKTVGGLSMLMGQSNISLKDLVKNWDDGVTQPFITDVYHWNMQFNEKSAIKGDYDVIARGSSSLVAKEVRANALAQFTHDLLAGAPNLGRMRELYAERARNLDLDPDAFLKSKAETEEDNIAMMCQQALGKLAETLGLDAQDLLQNFDQFLLQARQMLQEREQQQTQTQPQPQPQPQAGPEQVPVQAPMQDLQQGGDYA